MIELIRVTTKLNHEEKRSKETETQKLENHEEKRSKETI